MRYPRGPGKFSLTYAFGLSELRRRAGSVRLRRLGIPMALDLHELDRATRQFMLHEFDDEQARLPYVPAVLTAYGQTVWPTLMRDAIELGDDVTLFHDLLREPNMFSQLETYQRRGILHTRKINREQAAERLATSEFNTWYVRGVAARYIAEGVTEVVVYRAAEPRWAPDACSQHEGIRVPVQAVYDGHRAKYWPSSDPDAFSIPFQPGCHHSIRRAS